MVPLLCPTCGSTDVKKHQAFAVKESDSENDAGILSGAHLQCGECGARLTIRIERHRILIKWFDAR
ncbi:hypothetical protein [Steroidobacter denitrificans]|uniref:hypothetical protein n=1 Tax=Steroidobacter denitrificans TaxID=465721 RepID=UPI001AEF7154|nr:hypothetical protein [Steroidobacter denitrificans]